MTSHPRLPSLRSHVCPCGLHAAMTPEGIAIGATQQASSVAVGRPCDEIEPDQPSICCAPIPESCLSEKAPDS